MNELLELGKRILKRQPFSRLLGAELKEQGTITKVDQQ